MLQRQQETVGDGFIALEARDDMRNIARSYLVEVSEDLFGAIIVDSTWGRIGRRGQTKRVSFADRVSAARYVQRTLRKRSAARKRIGVDYEVVQSL